MSHKKFAATTGDGAEPAKIRFFYNTDKVFNSVSLRTTYRANMTKNQDGESQLDDVAISQDERDITLEFLADAIYEIGAELFKITEGINNSIFVDQAMIAGTGSITDAAAQPTTTADTVGKLFKVTTSWGGFAINDVVSVVSVYVASPVTAATFELVSGDSSGFEIRDNAAFNENLIPSLDKKIEAALRYYIMREWYASTGLQNDMALNAALYKANIIKVKNLTFQLRKPLMS